MARPKEFDARMDLLCNERQKLIWRKAATAAGLDLSTWCRLVLDEQAQSMRPLILHSRLERRP